MSDRPQKYVYILIMYFNNFIAIYVIICYNTHVVISMSIILCLHQNIDKLKKILDFSGITL